MLRDLGVDLASVVGEIDLLSRYESGSGNRSKSRSDEIAVQKLSTRAGRSSARHRVESHRVSGFGCDAKPVLGRGARGRLDGVDDAGVILAVVARGAHPRADDAALGEALAGGHYRADLARDRAAAALLDLVLVRVLLKLLTRAKLAAPLAGRDDARFPGHPFLLHFSAASAP